LAQNNGEQDKEAVICWKDEDCKDAKMSCVKSGDGDNMMGFCQP